MYGVKDRECHHWWNDYQSILSIIKSDSRHYLDVWGQDKDLIGSLRTRFVKRHIRRHIQSLFSFFRFSFEWNFNLYLFLRHFWQTIYCYDWRTVVNVTEIRLNIALLDSKWLKKWLLIWMSDKYSFCVQFVAAMLRPVVAFAAFVTESVSHNSSCNVCNAGECNLELWLIDEVFSE